MGTYVSVLLKLVLDKFVPFSAGNQHDTNSNQPGSLFHLENMAEGTETSLYKFWRNTWFLFLDSGKFIFYLYVHYVYTHSSRVYT